MFFKSKDKEQAKAEEARDGFIKWMKNKRPASAIPSIEIALWQSTSGYPKLPADRRAVYSFYWQGKVLKVGKAGGANAGTRYSYQHYRCDPQSSTLANSVVARPDLVGEAAIACADVGDWLKRNTKRVDFIMPATTGSDTVDAFERYLISAWDPTFEGTRI